MNSTAGATARLTVPTARRHATESEYAAWVKAFIPHYAARYQRMVSYRRFVHAWPDLEDWFRAPLLVRAGFTGGTLRATGRTDTFDASGYLVYLSLVHGVGLDYEFLFVRKYARLFSIPAGGKGLGVDLDLFAAHTTRLTELGYRPESSRTNLTWAAGRLLLHRGDPDIRGITAEDLFDMAEQVRCFGQREDFAQLRAALYQKSPWQMTGDNAGERFAKAHLAKVHCLHVLLFNIGQVSDPPLTGTRRRKNWEENLLPEPCPPRIRAVIERYLLTRLEAQFDRPQTVRIAREGLRRLVNWLGREHPDITSLTQLDRTLIEEYLRWLPTYPSQNTGQPLHVTTRKHEINAIGAFCRDTGIWGWDDVPGRPLITTRDAPRRQETIPRYLPRHELDALMTAIEGLADPLQRTALLLLRWSGARRDEIRRLTWDCLDTYASGHPRLRIPVGKGYSERLIPLHADAAVALQDIINQAKAMKAVSRRDPTTGRLENYIFVRKGKLLSSATLFDDAFEKACTAAGLVDSKGTRTVSAHRLRHTLGTQLAEGGARIQTIMTILGHKSASMSMIYSRISLKSDANTRKRWLPVTVLQGPPQRLL